MIKANHLLAVLTVPAAMFILACDSTTTSEDILLIEDAEISSSAPDTTVSSSSEASSETSSDVSSSATSSSSQDPSSSEAVSSSEISSSDSAPNIVKLDSLPFDTAGIDPDTLHYTYILDEFTDEGVLNYYRTEYGENLENFVSVTVGDGYYCHIGTGGAGGMGDYQNVYTTQTPADYIFMEHGDSLLFAYVENCATLSWDGCHEPKSNNAFMQKITVGNDTLYYSKTEKWLQLAKVTDSSIIVWDKQNPSYEYDSTTTAKKFEWRKSDFEGDTLVKFISDDTIFIEKYNLKITDSENTWIFENEVCSNAKYERPAGITDRESCKALETYHNDAIKCRQRNLNIPYPRIFPSLCRPKFNISNDVWCILDETLESLLVL